MCSYRVVFIKKGRDGEADQILGHLTIDDNGVNESFTLAAKAFRTCSPVLLGADILQFNRI